MASHDGRKLVAHELSHTLQAENSVGGTTRVSRKDDTKKSACKKAKGKIRPVFIREDAKDKSPTGVSLKPRLEEANRIWDKCGVSFSADASRTIEGKDTKHANTRAEFSQIMKDYAKSGSGPEVFFFDSDLKKFGGGVEGPQLGDIGNDAKIMMSDQGTNKRLLAHELGHAMGSAMLHPGGAGYMTAGTIMEPSGIDATNPDIVTKSLCTLIEWPENITDRYCLHPDPDPPKAEEPKETPPHDK